MHNLIQIIYSPIDNNEYNSNPNGNRFAISFIDFIQQGDIVTILHDAKLLSYQKCI